MSSNEYQKKLDTILQETQHNPAEHKPSLLLHACCGPCSSYTIEYLSKFFDIYVYYYNPNIYPPQEYERRLSELERFLGEFPPALECGVKLQKNEYIPQEFYEAIRIKEEPLLAEESEKGERCRRCYEFRLKKAYAYAAENGFDWFCTTLSISPFKDADKINTIGAALEQQNPSGPKWLYSDFKKKGGFKRSLELSEQFNLYRQQYCGCVYSAKNRHGKE